MRDADSARTVTPVRLEPDSTSARLTPDDTAIVEPESRYEESGRIAYAEPTIFASAIEEPRRRSGLSIWFAAAASLVLGIVIGFASGYRAGQGASDAAAAVDRSEPASGSASQGKPFTESSVPDPVRIEPEEIVPAPTPAPAPRPASVASTPPVGRTPAAPPGTPAPGVPAPRAPRSAVARPPMAAVEEKLLPTGPASLQVVSRPSGADVIIDGKSVGRTPLSIEMSPGEHTVRLALPGFNDWQKSVDVKPGSLTRVSGSLEQ